MFRTIEFLKFVTSSKRKKKTILYVEANPKYKYVMETFITTFYVHSFEKAEGNTPFSCDITCFNRSEDIPYDVEGTLLKWLSSSIFFLHKIS